MKVKATAAELTSELKGDYERLLQKYKLEDPLSSDNTFSFTDDVTYFPGTNVGQIFAYILQNKAFETEYIGQYKIRKAYSFFKSGMVGKIYTSTTSPKIIRSLVTPSQRINDDKHKLWILFDEKNNVTSSFCSCTAGFSHCCNHVVATLYKIDYANEKGFTDPTCTEQLCYWNSSSKDFTPMKIKDMNIVEHNQEKQNKQKIVNYKEKQSFDPRPESQRIVSEKWKEDFLQNIKSVLPTAVINTCFFPPVHQDIPSPLPALAQNVRASLTNAEKR